MGGNHRQNGRVSLLSMWGPIAVIALIGIIIGGIIGSILVGVIFA